MPVLRISNAYIESVEFLLRLSFGCRRHPVKRFNPLAKSRGNIGDQLLSLGLGCRREVALSIDFSHGIAQPAVHYKNAALPARPLLWRAKQCLAKKRVA